MKIILIFILLFYWSLGFTQSDEKVDERQVDVILGIDKIIRFDYVASPKVQVGNPSIVAFEIFPRKKEVTFKGLKVGKTSITLRNPVGDIRGRYLVNVTANDQSELIQKLKEFLGHIEGLEIGVKGGTVYLGGKLVVPSDMGLINLVLKKFPDVMEMVELSPMAQVLVGQKMQNEIQRAGLRDVTVRVVNKAYWLEGVVGSAGQKTKAFSIAKAYLPESLASIAEREQAVQKAGQKSIIQNFINVNAKKTPPAIPKLIRIAAHFVELSKDYNRVFGFKWSPLMSTTGASIQFGKQASDGLSTQSQGTLAGTISNLLPKLASAKSAGQARVIQSGMVIVKDGTQAKLAKKSSKPFAIGTGEFVKAEKAESGFDLGVTPKVLSQEKIELAMGISVSASIGDPPEVQSNTISTSMVVKSKDSAVVGGVVINRDSTEYDRNPPFGNNPNQGGTPLFSFLRSKSITKGKSQFVIFVTPEIIANAASGTDDILKKFKRGRN
ncbi:MAG: pilus assembly protein N-terminal domain-containing protein [Bdellovibrionales bacterium]|nr:pilus assembly protein N-terminal domain-containing protein [Bdellovibrionales bacterium]